MLAVILFLARSLTRCRYEYRVFHGDDDNEEPLEVLSTPDAHIDPTRRTTVEYPHFPKPVFVVFPGVPRLVCQRWYFGLWEFVVVAYAGNQPTRSQRVVLLRSNNPLVQLLH